jgi:hypothetical protein
MGEKMNAFAFPRNWLGALILAAFWSPIATYAQEIRTLSSGQSIYLPIYSHMLYGNLGRSGRASQVLLSALVSIRNTDVRRPLRILSLELFVELNDASGGSGANFIITWDSDAPVNPPLVEALHANMDGGKAVIFMTQSVPINDPAALPTR